MNKIVILFFLAYLPCVSYSQEASVDKQEKQKPVYGGKIEFAKGGFGGYNYPQQDDSVLVYITDSTQIRLKVFSSKDKQMPARDLHINFNDLKLLKRKEYQEIVSMDKRIATNNYDMKFSSASKTNYSSTVSITHYSNGSVADLTVMVEKDGLQIYDLFLAKLTKFK